MVAGAARLQDAKSQVCFNDIRVRSYNQSGAPLRNEIANRRVAGAGNIECAPRSGRMSVEVAIEQIFLTTLSPSLCFPRVPGFPN